VTCGTPEGKYHKTINMHDKFCILHGMVEMKKFFTIEKSLKKKIVFFWFGKSLK